MTPRGPLADRCAALDLRSSLPPKTRVEGSPSSIVGRTLAERYAVERELGHGGTAVVYLARDVSQGRMVAIKTLRPELAETLIAPRFLREVRLTAALHHPHIVPLLDSGESDGMLYCVMPYMDGGTLRDRLAHERQLPLDEAVAIARTIAGALAAAHGKGLVHRDVKPANILFVGGQACLGDFGIARALARGSGDDDASTTTGIVRGTPAYMSPEQAAGDQRYDGRSDVYSLGCVLYEMVAGVQPFVGPSSESVLAQRMVHSPQPLAVYRPAVPPELAEVIDRALMTAAADRYQTAAELDGALASVEPLLTRGRTTSQRIRATSFNGVNRRRWLVGGGVVAVAALGAAVATRILNPPEPLDANRLVVAPFDVLAAEDTVWHTGFVDVLSRSFDGAGPLRTVSASVTLQYWKGTRSDAASATQLARKAHAGLAVFGQLMRAGADSLKLAASLVDVVSGRTLEVEVRDEANRMERMGDSVTVRLLRELGTIRPIAAVARASMLSRSLPALKAFLQGEQLYRANEVLAARDKYQIAINADTGFALAYHRMRGVWRAIASENDSTGYSYARLAGERNHGLAPRDSLLIVADSLAAAKAPGSVFLDYAGLAQLHRRVAALELAAKRYPDDAEVQFELGEAAYHIGERVGLPQQRALAAFLKAIRLDPKFLPAYYHAIELAPPLDSTETAIRLAQGYDELNPRERRYTLFIPLLRARRPAELDRAIAETDRLPVDAVVEAIQLTRRWPDSLATAVKLSQRLLRRPRLTHDDSARARYWLSTTLLFRGRVREAWEVFTPDINTENVWNLTELARFRAAPPDSAVEIGRRWAERVDDRGLYLGIPLLELSRDSVSLQRLVSRFQNQLTASKSHAPQTVALIGAGSAQARLRLLRGDSDGALHEYLRIPDSLCSWWCADDRLTTARLLLAKEMRTQALDYLNHHPPGGGPTTLEESLWLYERSRAERATSPSDADRDLSFVRRALSHADPSIQGMLHLGQPAPSR